MKTFERLPAAYETSTVTITIATFLEAQEAKIDH